MNVGGPAKCVISLSSNLREHGIETVVAAGKPDSGEGDMSPQIESAGGRLVRVRGLKRNISILTDLPALIHIRKLIREIKPDIIHTHTAKAGFLGRIAALRIKPKPVMIHTYHGHVLDSYFGNLKSSIYRKIEKLLAGSTDALIAVSASVRDELLSRHGIGRARQYRIIPSGFPSMDLTTEETLRDEFVLKDAVVAGMVARMTPIKGHELLIKAIPSILEQAPNIKFLIAGDGPLRRKIESLASAPPVKDAVFFTGALLNMAPFYKTIDFLIVPSLKEGLPTVVLEAAAAKIPVAASSIPGVMDLLDDEESALLFDSGSPQQLSRAVVKLATDPKLRDRLAEKANETVLKMVPDYKTVAKSHASLYKELMEQM